MYSESEVGENQSQHSAGKSEANVPLYLLFSAFVVRGLTWSNSGKVGRVNKNGK